MTNAARIHRLLDRPAGRRVLGLLHSVRHLASQRKWVPIRWRDEGYWEIVLPDRVMSQPHPDPQEYLEKERIARDAYFDRYEPRSGDIVMHIGAGAGWEAHLLSSLVGPTGHVYLIEAHPGTYEWLERRVRVGGLRNATPIMVAVTDRKGTVTISDSDRHQLNRIVDGPGLEVPSDTIADLMSDHGLDHIDLVMINIEGAERDAVNGIGDSAQNIRHMAVSCHDFLADRGGDDSTRTRDDVMAKLAAYGFDVTVRDQNDPRDWIRGYVYAGRNPATIAQTSE